MQVSPLIPLYIYLDRAMQYIALILCAPHSTWWPHDYRAVKQVHPHVKLKFLHFSEGTTEMQEYITSLIKRKHWKERGEALKPSYKDNEKLCGMRKERFWVQNWQLGMARWQLKLTTGFKKLHLMV